MKHGGVLPVDTNSLLLVDDNVFLTHAWTRILDTHGYRVSVARTVEEGLKYAIDWATRRCNFVLLDLKLPDGDGTELLPVFARLEPRPRVAVVTSHLTYERSLDLHGQCVVSVPKPQGMTAILQLMEVLQNTRSDEPKQNRALELFVEKYGLSARQAAVIGHSMLGPDLEPDRALGCKMTTIRSLWQRVFDKTGYRSQVEVIRAVLRLGID